MVIVVYTVGCWSNASSDVWEHLDNLKFSLPKGQEKGGEGLGVGVGPPPSTQNFDYKVKGVEVLGCDESCASRDGLRVEFESSGAVCKVCEVPMLCTGECSDCGLWQAVSCKSCMSLGLGVDPEAEAQLSAGSEEAVEGTRVCGESLDSPWLSCRMACDSAGVKPEAEAQLSAESEGASDGSFLLHEGLREAWLSSVFEFGAPDVSSGVAGQGDLDGNTAPDFLEACIGDSLEESLFTNKAGVDVGSRDIGSGDELAQDLSDADDAASVFSCCTASEGEAEQMDDEQVWPFQQFILSENRI